MTQTIDYATLKTIIDQSGPGGPVLIDVRTVAEYEQGHIPGALLIPLGQLESIRTMYGADQALIVYCRSGVRSLTAAQKLTEWGYADVRGLEGGIIRWPHSLVPGTPRQLASEEARSLPALLLLALKREAEATMTYTELSVKARSAAQKRILIRLADAEREHLDRLYPWYVGSARRQRPSAFAADARC